MRTISVDRLWPRQTRLGLDVFECRHGHVDFPAPRGKRQATRVDYNKVCFCASFETIGPKTIVPSQSTIPKSAKLPSSPRSSNIAVVFCFDHSSS